ncbi:ParB-like protein [Caballeronia ptereochthonis]|uniref:Chromosome partitioning protein ParB n=1 Tax=Caballeronia ptereochthonis TaxID=1777144 RepID=A0A157ZYH4_9BURK|nr:ParB-like protein [Caballeronia ptereochthonis]SAK50529.1 chromosome partitioning protein ParB [Caballeronia ptereochthonis]
MANITRVDIAQLRPMQATVGMLEVDAKRKHLRALDAKALRDFLKSAPIPTVLGKRDRHYIIDHHHLARALADSGIAEAYVEVAADLSRLPNEEFWNTVIAHKWVHPYDERGMLRALSAIPDDVKDLADDPYRSLAAFVRNAGGYLKTPEPFAEFQWADFYRTRVPLWTNEFQFNAVVEQSIHLASSPDARTLPGFKLQKAVASAKPAKRAKTS